MKRRNVVYICAPDDYAPDEQWSAAIDYISAEQQKRYKFVFSGFATRPTLRSALRFALRAYRATGCAMIVQRQVRNKRRVREWLVKEEL